MNFCACLSFTHDVPIRKSIRRFGDETIVERMPGAMGSCRAGQSMIKCRAFSGAVWHNVHVGELLFLLNPLLDHHGPLVILL